MAGQWWVMNIFILVDDLNENEFVVGGYGVWQSLENGIMVVGRNEGPQGVGRYWKEQKM